MLSVSVAVPRLCTGINSDHLRCIRHKAIYGVKWPARTKAEEQPYPPVNMRPSWWVPPRISKYQYTATAAPEVDRSTYVDDMLSADPQNREAERLEYQARQEAKRLNRKETLTEDAAAKFRKDLEAAQIKMRKFEQEYAVAREAAKTKAKLHSGGGNWGRYEYVWEEEDPGQSSKVAVGSKRSNRATSFANSPPRFSKRRRIDESSTGEGSKPSVSRYGRERRATEKSAANGSSSARPRVEAKEHPAKRRAERARPPGPIFSAIPPSPSKEIIAENDFDILPIPDMPDAVTTTSRPRKDDGHIEDIYDSDVEIIASNVSCAVREGRLEEEYGSNINPISLVGEEDNVIGDSDANDDNDISYSAHFDASAPHLMPVTPGSVKEGGVPEGTTSDNTTGMRSFPSHPNNKNKTGITPLKSREIFRGTLSSPDTPSFGSQCVVRPESYQSPKALLERGKGTRAAITAQERTLSGKTSSPADERRRLNPLLYSAEAEIARARQVAAFLEGARRRKDVRTPLTHRRVRFSRSPRSTSPSQSADQEEEIRGQQDNSDSPDTLNSGPGQTAGDPQPTEATVVHPVQQDTDDRMPVVSGHTSDNAENLDGPAPMEEEGDAHMDSAFAAGDHELASTAKLPILEPSLPTVETGSDRETATTPAQLDPMESAVDAEDGHDTVVPPTVESEPDLTLDTAIGISQVEATTSTPIIAEPVAIQGTNEDDIQDPIPTRLEGRVDDRLPVAAVEEPVDASIGAVEITPEPTGLSDDSVREETVMEKEHSPASSTLANPVEPSAATDDDPASPPQPVTSAANTDNLTSAVETLSDLNTPISNEQEPVEGASSVAGDQVHSKTVDVGQTEGAIIAAPASDHSQEEEFVNSSFAEPQHSAPVALIEPTEPSIEDTVVLVPVTSTTPEQLRPAPTEDDAESMDVQEAILLHSPTAAGDLQNMPNADIKAANNALVSDEHVSIDAVVLESAIDVDPVAEEAECVQIEVAEPAVESTGSLEGVLQIPADTMEVSIECLTPSMLPIVDQGGVHTPGSPRTEASPRGLVETTDAISLPNVDSDMILGIPVEELAHVAGIDIPLAPSASDAEAEEVAGKSRCTTLCELL